VYKLPGGALEELSDALPLSSEALAKLGLRGIHCGCATNLQPGWLNIDRLRFVDAAGRESVPGRLIRIDSARCYLEHDLTRPLPVADAVFDWAFSEHFIEHVSPEQAIAWLREMRRVLKGGGVLRISTPDLRRYAAGYVNRSDGFFERHRRGLLALGFTDVPTRPAWMMNQIFRFWGHQWIYDFDELRMALVTAGFAQDAVVECSFRTGQLPQVCELDRPVRSDESLYVEVRRT
jgi:predicted SAM-dependent methyltransferase